MAATTLELPSAQLPDAPATHTTVEQPWRPRINPWIVAMTVTLATFMEVLDSSIANVALPHIAGGLGATQDEATWV
jgi:DHA2 family multidrug resistance protein